MKQMTLSILATLVPLLGAVATPVQTERAQSATDQLERGIYKEETAGDLEAAIEIYRNVIDAADASRHAQAEAQLRLGLCYLKLGRRAEARDVLQRLVNAFPDQDVFAERGRRQLASWSSTTDVELGPAPWKDGEVLILDGKFPGGKSLGTLALHARSDTFDGQDVWRFQLRRFIATTRNNRGISDVFALRDTHVPLRGTFLHGLLGNVESTYGKSSVRVLHEGPEENLDRTFEFDGPVYDNESIPHLIRRLPLAEGYEVTLPVMITFVNGLNMIDLTVEGIESVTVPAGTFECYKTVLSIGETHWYSTDADRYPVKIKTGGVSFELSQVSLRPAGSLGTYSNADFGASVTLPDGWLADELQGSDRQLVTLLLDPRMRTQSVIELGLTDPAKAWSLQDRVERELAGVKRKLDGYTLTTRTDMTVDGRPVIRFTGTYTQDEQAMIQDRAYIVLPERWVEFIFKVPAEHYEELRPELTRIIESCRVQS